MKDKKLGYRIEVSPPFKDVDVNRLIDKMNKLHIPIVDEDRARKMIIPVDARASNTHILNLFVERLLIDGHISNFISVYSVRDCLAYNKDFDISLLVRDRNFFGVDFNLESLDEIREKFLDKIYYRGYIDRVTYKKILTDFFGNKLKGNHGENL